MFDNLKGYDVRIFFFKNNKIAEILKSKDRHGQWGFNQPTIATEVMDLTYTMGCRNFDLYGMDSSYASENEHHCVKQEWNDNKNTCKIHLNGVEYISNGSMVEQYRRIQLFCSLVKEEGGNIHILSDGLIKELLNEKIKDTKG
jgi:hypothetical protein